ncbi:MAG: translation initiation factor Sui1 [Desulfobacteraceae bacterium]|nr:translation initiation factor Sui1 [Desulfobacteraceae bacterium]MCF8111860.1 translation initiation factor Sui1 [Desulfobacteraceae bacterium]
MARSSDSNTRLVYTTEEGGLCRKCGKPAKKCTCRTKQKAPAGDGTVRVSRETKGRKGKGVTLITGLGLDENQLKQLAKRLKAKCGSGGTVKNGIIEIQGDRRDILVEELGREGFTIKRAGG